MSSVVLKLVFTRMDIQMEKWSVIFVCNTPLFTKLIEYLLEIKNIWLGHEWLKPTGYLV